MAGQRDNLVRVPTSAPRTPPEFVSDASPPGDRAGGAGVSPLHEVDQFGSNPGQLRMFVRSPERLTEPRPLVVCLHGCAQSAASYDAGSGWSVLAERHGFVAVFPEQQARNNPNRCFTWYQAGDTSRDSGEALSIRQMIDYAIAAYDVDPNRIFVTGLSAGGAMASSLLSGYPDLFAGGAIVAGLPHGSAANVYDAIEAMARGRERTPQQWGEIVRLASPHRGPWPRLAIWHGTDDAVVHPANAEASALQWIDLHEVTLDPTRDVTSGDHHLRIWRDSRDQDVIELHTIKGMGHGVALAADGEEGCGQAGPFHFDVGIASSVRILDFFGITAEGWKSDDAVSPSAAADSEQRQPSISGGRGR